MRIGIDIRYLSHALLGGVHTYVEQLLPELLDLASGDELVLIADTKRAPEIADLPRNARLRLLPWRSPASSVWNDLLMPALLVREHLDVVHFPANYGFGPRGTRTVLTVHDAINLLPLRESFVNEIRRGHVRTPRVGAMILYLHALTTVAVARASMLLTVSHYAARDISAWSGFPLDRILVAPHAVPPDVKRVDDPTQLRAVRDRYDLTRGIVMADALKNPAVLLRAWSLLRPEVRERYEVVFFSRTADVEPAVRQAAETGIARFLLRPSRADLLALYSQCAAFVFPSWIEGFGIPVIEAMACGAPVIASDRGGIPEAADGAALLMDAEDERALADHLERVLTDADAARALRDAGFARVSRLSWRETARVTLEAYRRAARA